LALLGFGSAGAGRCLFFSVSKISLNARDRGREFRER
jgi:hypothetical protein